MAVKLRDTFSQFLRNGKVPDYLMMAKLILISKDETNTPTIDKVRPIGVLPAITKLFELSIINKLKKVFISPKFNNQQRGFMEGKSTRDNINDLLKFGRDIQKKRKEDKTTAALVFFDLKNAYDTVPRDLLIKKIEQFNIPCNITAVVNDLLDKFRLKYENIIIETKRGLVQG